jgi:L-ribulose-5-phosphate 3-epimerase
MQIAVSAWSFHQALYNGKLRQVDVLDQVAGLGFERVELLEMFLRPKPPGRLARLFARRRAPTSDARTPQPDYGRKTLSELRSARLRVGVRLVCWAIDTDLTSAHPETRRAQLTHIATALEAARYLGAPLVRITTGGQAGDVTGVKRAIDMLRNIAVVAASSGVRLAIENHFGLSENVHTLAQMVTAIHQPNVGVCLDLGNFVEGEFAEGVKTLAPLAIHAHAKSREFGPDGQETQIDYRVALSALGAAGYDGTISIEYEGEGDPVEGIRKTRALIEQHWNK